MFKPILKDSTAMDKLDKEKRSWNMSRIHSKDTVLELKVRRFLFAKGLHYRLHSDLPGKPDIVFRGKKKVIFINGCFWHGHKKCKVFRIPKSNISFWKKKINANIIRDERNYRYLRKSAWKMRIVWECRLDKNCDNQLENLFHWIVKEDI